jgi:hypothetical protein
MALLAKLTAPLLLLGVLVSGCSGERTDTSTSTGTSASSGNEQDECLVARSLAQDGAPGSDEVECPSQDGGDSSPQPPIPGSVDRDR